MRKHGARAWRRTQGVCFFIVESMSRAQAKRKLLERCPLAAAMKQEQEAAKAEQAEHIEISRCLRSMLGGL